RACVYTPEVASPRWIARSTPPITSTFSGVSLFSFDGRLKWIITIAIAASGTLIQKTSRQLCSAHTTAMPYSGPSTLPSSCAAPMPPSTLARLRADHRSAATHVRAVGAGQQVGRQRQRHRQQRATGGALDRSADDEGQQVIRQRGDDRADSEPGQAYLQHQFAAEAVRGAAQQWHGRDVAQEIPGDDRCGPLDLID